MKRLLGTGLVCALPLVLTIACSPSAPAESDANAKTPATEGKAQEIDLDGSSTVTPIMEAVAEEFGKENSSKPTVGTSGTGGGFKKFAAGEIDIAMASRPIKQEEIDKLAEAGIDFVELPIALDGITMTVNKENTWAKSLTVDELKKIWEPESKVNNWKDVRAGFPDVPLKLYGPGSDSGTFDYFTMAVCGKEKASRADYQPSEDDNVLVQGVMGDKGALGYFGYSYFESNKDSILAVPIDAGKGPVGPSAETIGDATYQPLSRPLFIYISMKSLNEKSAIADFVDYLLEKGAPLITEAKYLPLPTDALETVKAHWKDRKTGTLFKGAEVGLGINEIMARESGH